MPTFVCEAMDSQGHEVATEVEAASEHEATNVLRGRNLFPTRVLPKNPRPCHLASPRSAGAARRRFGFALRVKQSELTEATRQLATLLEAGVSLVRSLDVIQKQLPPGLLRTTLASVKEDVEGGSALSEALTAHPRVFDRLYVNMIRAGESGGVLDEILSRLADYREKAQRLQQKIIGALIYPAAVILIASGILALIMIFIIPRFEAMFREMGMGQLPLPTQILMLVAGTMVSFWYLLLLAPVFVVMGYRLLVKTAAGRLLVDRCKLALPIFGMIVSKSCISRFCRTLGTLLQSGVPILEALAILKDATGNQVVANAIGAVHASIKQGDTIAGPLCESGVFDGMVVNMIQVGEETGQLDKMLIKIADTYDNSVDTLVAALMSLLEPVLIVGMGVVVGFIVISLFLPILSFMSNIT